MRLFLVLIVFLFASFIVVGAADNSWNELSPKMQTLLGEYKNDWNKLSIKQKNNLINRGQQWLSTDSEHQKKLWQRFQRWQAMSQSQRINMQKSYERFQSLSQHERQHLLKTYSKFAKKTFKQRQEMIKKFKHFQSRGGYAVQKYKQKHKASTADSEHKHISSETHAVESSNSMIQEGYIHSIENLEPRHIENITQQIHIESSFEYQDNDGIGRAACIESSFGHDH